MNKVLLYPGKEKILAGLKSSRRTNVDVQTRLSLDTDFQHKENGEEDGE